MKIKIQLFYFSLLGLFFCPISAISKPFMANDEVIYVKQHIIELARSFKGQGDPDRSKQKELEAWVKKLLQLVPQAPVDARLPLIEGAWHQIWGPYDYSSHERGVDQSIDQDHIYQIIFKEGYYYNVNPNREKNKLRIGLLRGVYALNSDDKNNLSVNFTKFNEIKGCPEKSLDYTDLPALSESGNLKNETWKIPSWLVKLFFRKGTLQEVYTDSNLRITFGSNQSNFQDNYIYILERVEHAPILECK